MELPSDEEIKRLHQRIEQEILKTCEAFGYGSTIDVAARHWAKIYPMDRKSMAIWLRTYADELEKTTASTEQKNAV